MKRRRSKLPPPLFKVARPEEAREAVSESYWEQQEKRANSRSHRQALALFLPKTGPKRRKKFGV